MEIVKSSHLRPSNRQFSQLIKAQGPAIETRKLQTRVTVDPEETLVLGGIYESREENVLVGIPGLSSIPILGQAFQSSQRRAFKSELLIFSHSAHSIIEVSCLILRFRSF